MPEVTFVVTKKASIYVNGFLGKYISENKTIFMQIQLKKS